MRACDNTVSASGLPDGLDVAAGGLHSLAEQEAGNSVTVTARRRQYVCQALR